MLSQQFIKEYILSDLLSIMNERPMVLLRLRGSRPADIDCDIQKNLNTEDLLGICGAFSEISDDITACCDQQKSGRDVVVIVTSRNSLFAYLYSPGDADPTR